jgi:DNA-binding transcriptional LysR family regulator
MFARTAAFASAGKNLVTERISRARTPVDLSDVAQHKCLYVLAPMGQSDRWIFTGPNGEEMFDLGPAPLRVNIPKALSIAVKEGMGIGLVPALTAIPLLKSGALHRVLPDYTAQHLTIYTLYPSRQYLDAKVRVLSQ